jgi:formamidopyrimidine-DNA glycosylase
MLSRITPFWENPSVPELPDVELYVDALSRLLGGERLERLRISSPFLLRSVGVPPREAEGKVVRGFRRLGKRIVWELEEGPFLVVHLMVAGRFHWKGRPGGGPAPVPKKGGLAAFDFAKGTLLLTEQGSKRRASLHVVRTGSEALALHRGGLEPIGSTLADFRGALLSESHTLKRALTDPRLFSGIGNAYSDEILHAARLSPAQRTGNLSGDELAALHQAVVETLGGWTRKLREETGDSFPERVTAFRPGMAVHGRYGQPCPRCGAAVQRIVYAENESNYCAPCQTGGKLLADRALSRLLHGDWPRTLEELEEAKALRRSDPTS